MPDLFAQTQSLGADASAEAVMLAERRKKFAQRVGKVLMTWRSISYIGIVYDSPAAPCHKHLQPSAAAAKSAGSTPAPCRTSGQQETHCCPQRIAASMTSASRPPDDCTRAK